MSKKIESFLLLIPACKKKTSWEVHMTLNGLRLYRDGSNLTYTQFTALGWMRTSKEIPPTPFTLENLSALGLDLDAEDLKEILNADLRAPGYNRELRHRMTSAWGIEEN